MHIARILPAKLKYPALDSVMSRNNIFATLSTTIRHDDYMSCLSIDKRIISWHNLCWPIMYNGGPFHVHIISANPKNIVYVHSFSSRTQPLGEGNEWIPINRKYRNHHEEDRANEKLFNPGHSLLGFSCPLIGDSLQTLKPVCSSVAGMSSNVRRLAVKIPCLSSSSIRS